MAKRKTVDPNLALLVKEFIDGQFAIMKKFGKAPKLTNDQYRKLLSDTAKSFKRLEPLKT